MKITKNNASYRDPSGNVYNADDRIIRTVTGHAKSEYEYIRNNKTLKKLQQKNWIIEANEIDINQFIDNFPDNINKNLFYIIEHPKIPFISYPYEWSFSLLKAAALRHLEIQQELLGDEIVLSDASAYNIQFINGINPIFIDYLSFVPYREGDFWFGHKQFCEQFLNPLLLRSYLGISHNSWYRGNIEGISIKDIRKILPFYRKLSFRVLTNIVLPDKYQDKSLDNLNLNIKKIDNAKLPKMGYLGMLNQLHSWISKLKPSDKNITT
ncbi:MAG: class I SAM-dependent methyltransferase, partial [Candidatus Dadabacteria bacterium]|nr:class I SAM-dependent methyltransferase [Candidatus Dadabacteria bacterium]